MADDKTPGVLLKGAEGHYFIPHAELARFAVPGNADPEGSVAANATRVDAFAVHRSPAGTETEEFHAQILATEHDSARILAAENH